MKRPRLAILATLVLIGGLIVFVVAMDPAAGGNESAAENVETGRLEIELQAYLSEQLKGDTFDVNSEDVLVTDVQCTRESDTKARCLAQLEPGTDEEPSQMVVDATIDQDTGEVLYEPQP